VDDFGVKIDLSDFFSSVSTEKKKKKEEFNSIVGELNLNSIFEEVTTLKKKTKIKKKKEEKTLEAFENWLYSNKVKEQPIEEVQEIVEEVIDEVQEIVDNIVEKNTGKDSSYEWCVEESPKTDEKSESLIEKSLGLLSEPSSTKVQNDPLTPLDQNFATLDDLQKHYRLFLNRIQQQLSTLGGGGETQLRYLDDIVGIATNPSAYNSKFLQWDSSSNKAEFVNINSGNVSGIVTGYYGNFFDTTTQTIVGVNTHQPVRLNTTDLSNQVSIANSSHIVVANSGVYNIQFSLQIDKTQGSGAHIYIWLRKNGLDVPNSATELAVQGTSSEIVAAWNFVVASNANDYYELMISATDVHIRLKAVSASGVVPAIPSVIVSVVSV
jgi:DNA-directed RNA polymerase subunit F